MYDLTIERLHHIYDLFDHVAVSFSGGKDSTAVLNMALVVARERKRLPLHVVFYDEEAIPMEIEHYVRRVAQNTEIDLRWYCLPVSHTNACSSTQSTWITWDPNEKHRWVRDLPPEAITTLEGYDPSKEILSIPQLGSFMFPPTYGSVGWMLGIRAAESLTRYQAVSRREEENYIVKSWAGDDFGGAKHDYGNLYKVMPIYDWEVEDVWTAPAQYGWDYCEAYDMMEMAGVSPRDQRIAPPYGTQPMKSLWQYRVCFPDMWDKVVKRVDGANTAAMYANTDLYASGRIEKPDQYVTWMDYIEAILSDYDDPEMRSKVAKVIRKYINTNTKKVGAAPILPYISHPMSGLTWEILARIALRKDTKGRIRPDMKQVKCCVGLRWRGGLCLSPRASLVGLKGWGFVFV